MNKKTRIFPKSVLDHFEEVDRQVVNDLYDEDNTAYCRFDLLKTRSGFKYLYDRFERDIKPHLPWKQINTTLHTLPRGMKKENAEWVVFMLMPFPIEHLIVDEAGSEKIQLGGGGLDRVFEEKYGKSLTKIANEVIKRNSRLKGQLEKLQQDIIDFKGYEPIYWKQYEPLTLVIQKLDQGIKKFRILVEQSQKRKKICREIYSFDKNINKSPTKQDYWNKTILPALRILNRFCHTEKCSSKCSKPCKQTHLEAYRRVAMLLKILYPGVWTEDITTIAAQIKSREQRTA